MPPRQDKADQCDETQHQRRPPVLVIRTSFDIQDDQLVEGIAGKPPRSGKALMSKKDAPAGIIVLSVNPTIPPRKQPIAPDLRGPAPGPSMHRAQDGRQIEEEPRGFGWFLESRATSRGFFIALEGHRPTCPVKANGSTRRTSVSGTASVQESGGETITTCRVGATASR